MCVMINMEVIRIAQAQEVVHSVSLGQSRGHSPCFEFCADTYRPRLPRLSARLPVRPPPVRPSVRPSVRPGQSGSVRVRPVRPVRPGSSGWVDDANHRCNT